MTDINEGQLFRLKDLYNVMLEKKDGEAQGKYTGEELLPNLKKIQWVTEEYIEMEILKPSKLFLEKPELINLEKISGYAEKAVEGTEADEVVQFERFGFVKIERDNKGQISGIYTHK
jgi:glutamyl-tRNA synthetase